MDNLKQYIENFLTHIRIEKNYSPQTEQTYRIALNILITFIQKTNLNITDQNFISNFIMHLRERGNSDITIANRLAVLKSFFSWLVKKKIISKGKLPTIEKYKTTKKIISIPNDDEVNSFIAEIEKEYQMITDLTSKIQKPRERLKSKRFSLFRDLTFFSLLTATGLRISEALNIKLEDINFNDSSILIFGKGQKERLIFFSIPKLKKLFNELLEIRKENAIDSPYLFISWQRQKILSARYIQKIIKHYMRKAKLTNLNYTPHTLRHYYATRSIENGANIKAISILLGHSNISTTLKMYFHISNKLLKEVFETLNPFSSISMSVEEMLSKRYETLVNI